MFAPCQCCACCEAWQTIQAPHENEMSILRLQYYELLSQLSGLLTELQREQTETKIWKSAYEKLVKNIMVMADQRDRLLSDSLTSSV